jgi:hypothetical protein
MATDRMHPAATMFWLKCRDWREHGGSKTASATPPPFIVTIEPDEPAGLEKSEKREEQQKQEPV